MSRARLVILLLASAVLGWALSSRVPVLLQSRMPVSSGAVSEHDLAEFTRLLELARKPCVDAQNRVTCDGRSASGPVTCDGKAHADQTQRTADATNG